MPARYLPQAELTFPRNQSEGHLGNPQQKALEAHLRDAGDIPTIPELAELSRQLANPADEQLQNSQSSPHTPLKRDPQQLLRLDRELHRQLLQHFLGEPVDD